MYEAGYCMRRKRYSQTRKYQNKNTTQEHEDNLDKCEEEKEKRKRKKKKRMKEKRKKKIKPTNLFKWYIQIFHYVPVKIHINMLCFTEKLKESESQMKFSCEYVHMRMLLEVFTRLSAILFHLLKKSFHHLIKK